MSEIFLKFNFVVFRLFVFKFHQKYLGLETEINTPGNRLSVSIPQAKFLHATNISKYFKTTLKWSLLSVRGDVESRITTINSRK